MNGQGTKAGAAKSPWIQYVKSYMVTHNCTYKQALTRASESYKKSRTRQVVPRGRTIRAISPPPDTKMSDMRIRTISPPRKSKAVEALAQRNDYYLYKKK
jgi:hypothetical protein